MRHRFGLLALLVSFTLCSPAYASLGLVTGPKTGTYVALGRDMAKVAAPSGLTIDVLPSSGSIENIKRITSKEKVSLGIVQSDVLGFLSRSKNPDSIKIAKQLRMVLPLYNEEVHVLARRTITDFSDLNGKRIVVGTEGSGNMVTAVNLFSILGITPGRMFQVEPGKGVVAVLNDQADAIIFVGGKPVRMFKNMEDITSMGEEADIAKLNDVHFIPLSDPKLLDEYAPAMLTKDDYSFITEPVPTIAVTAVLMAYDFSTQSNKYRRDQCRNLALLTQAIRANEGWLKDNGHPKWKEVKLGADVGFWKKDACAWPQAGEGPSAGKPVDHNLSKDLIRIIRDKKE